MRKWKPAKKKSPILEVSNLVLPTPLKTAEGIPLDTKGMPVYGTHPVKGYAVCGAVDDNGAICLSHSRNKHGRCAKHMRSMKNTDLSDDLTPAELGASDNRFGPYLPSNIVEVYEAGLRNPELIALRDSIAALDAMACAELEQRQTGPLPDLYLAQRAFRELQRSMDMKNKVVAAQVAKKALEDLERAMFSADAKDKADRRYRELIQEARQCREAEMRRSQLLGQYITTGQVSLMFQKILGCITEVLATEPVLLRRLLGAIQAVQKTGTYE